MKLNEYYDFRDIATIDVYIAGVVTITDTSLPVGKRVIHLSADDELDDFRFFCGDNTGLGHWVDASEAVHAAIRSGCDDFTHSYATSCTSDPKRNGYQCENCYTLRVVITRCCHG